MNLPANVLAAASPAESTAPAAAPAGVKVVEEAAAYATANIISQVAAIVRGFVVARVLGPASFGIWNGLSIFMAYSGYTNLGLFVGMTREYCYFVGKNDRPKARVVRDTAFTFGTASALLVSLVIVMAAILVRQRYARPVIVGAMMMATIMLLDRVFQYHIALFRVERRILTLSVRWGPWRSSFALACTRSSARSWRATSSGSVISGGTRTSTSGLLLTSRS
jgi:O-antigen/teichoic acid export membrane protein